MWVSIFDNITVVFAGYSFIFHQIWIILHAEFSQKLVLKMQEMKFLGFFEIQHFLGKHASRSP